MAMRDLEIRGAGNLLGRRQHGHMEAVGYDLYCKMLNEAVKHLKGEGAEVDFPTNIDLDVDAYIPASYIMNEVQKLDIYKRIASIESQAEYEDMKEELTDRFGEIPKSAENLLRIALLRKQAHDLYLSDVQGKNEILKFSFVVNAPIKIENLPILLQKFEKKRTFHPKGTPYLQYRYKKCGVVEKDGEMLLELTERVMRDMKQILLEENSNAGV